jgi:hypothetical protein
LSCEGLSTPKNYPTTNGDADSAEKPQAGGVVTGNEDRKRLERNTGRAKGGVGRSSDSNDRE